MRGIPPWILTLPLILFWDSALVAPLKLLVVTAHEAGHSLAALATGGEVIDLLVSLHASGHATFRGGNQIIVLNAGYVASILAAVALLWLAKDPLGSRVGGVLFGLYLIFAGFNWFEPASAAYLGLLAVGSFIAFLIPFARTEVAENVLQTVGVFSAIYAVNDLVIDLFLAQSPSSDAAQLARLTELPALVWGGLWAALAFAVLYGMRRFLT